MLFVGLDVIGGFVTEINVTSPTGVREIDKQFGTDLAALLIDAIDRRLAARRAAADRHALAGRTPGRTAPPRAPALRRHGRPGAPRPADHHDRAGRAAARPGDPGHHLCARRRSRTSAWTTASKCCWCPTNCPKRARTTAPPISRSAPRPAPATRSERTPAELPSPAQPPGPEPPPHADSEADTLRGTVADHQPTHAAARAIVALPAACHAGAARAARRPRQQRPGDDELKLRGDAAR